jgi:hypothetical protein
VITIYTTAKPFTGLNRIHQMNALNSWKALSPDVEVILFGRGVGYQQAVQELGLVHIENVETSEQGTPLVNSMFALARSHGHYPIQMYVNCDIILSNDLLPAIRQVSFSRFAVIGQRWDVDLNEEINFDRPDWRQVLLGRVQQQGSLHPPEGSDYFVYRGDIWQGMPTLVVGRAGYDNYLIRHWRRLGVPVIDGSHIVTVIHQNHDYSHHPQGKAGVWSGPEARANLQGDCASYRFTLLDADWLLSSRGPVRNFARGDWERYLESYLVLHREEPRAKLAVVGQFLVRKVKRVRSRSGRVANEKGATG